MLDLDRRRDRRRLRGLRRTLSALGAAIALLPAAAMAKSHLWRFTEFFSNADGSVQFIEMVECCGSSEETQFRNFPLTSNANTYLFPNSLEGDTAFRWVLIATQSFADLPGAPTPDYIIPEQFFDSQGDTLTYRQVDTITIPANALPVDGRHSLARDLSTPGLTVQLNDPINFAGETGSVDASPAVPGLHGAALLALAAALGLLGAGSGLRALRAARGSG